MGSYNYGKIEICGWIRQHFDKDCTILDVGACDGKWRSLLVDYPNMDAVEIFQPNAEKIRYLYDHVFVCDICDLYYKHYDLVIFGDMIEHLTPDDAKKVLDYANEHCTDLIISVPFQYKQDALYGNKYEIHIQDDLTPELFNERFPGYELLLKAAEDYAYYHKPTIKER